MAEVDRQALRAQVRDVLALRGRPQAIATDLDGTLLTPTGTVSRRTAAMIERAEQAGLAFVMVTARPPRWVDVLAEFVGEHGMVLCANGAFEYDVHARRIVAEHTIDRGTLLELIADLRDGVPGIVFGLERSDGLALEPAYVSDYPIEEHARQGEASTLVDLLPGKLLARCPGMAADAFLSAVEQIVGERGHLAYSGAVGLAEISARGVTKAAVLARWCQTHDIDQDGVWAFGDMPNDEPMLRWAGVGVAVANGHPELHELADLIAPSNEVDGVAEVVELILEQLEDGQGPHRADTA